MAEINLAALLGGVGLFLLGMTMMSGGLKLSLGPALTRRLRDWTSGRLRGLLFGSVGAMLYSLAGAVLSLAVMALLRRIDRFSTVGISVAGGVAHNAGQILMAMLILQTKQLLGYLPVLAVSGIAGGVLTGLAAALLIRRIPEF